MEEVEVQACTELGCDSRGRPFAVDCSSATGLVWLISAFTYMGASLLLVSVRFVCDDN